MDKKWEKVFNDTLGFTSTLINSSLLSAQSRKRLYWFGMYNEVLSEYQKIKIEQPKDKDILLKDILEDNYYTDRDKSFCIDANYYKGGNLKTYFNKSRRQLVFSGAMRGRYLDADGKRLDSTVKSLSNLTTQRIEVRTDNKSNCLTTVQKDSLVIYKQPRGYNDGKIFTDKSPSVTSCSWQENNKLHYSPTNSINAETLDNELVYYRKLTVNECARLQTFPDNYFNMISKSQAYKCIGNSWTVDIIAHQFNYLKDIDKIEVVHELQEVELKLF